MAAMAFESARFMRANSELREGTGFEVVVVNWSRASLTNIPEKTVRLQFYRVAARKPAWPHSDDN